MSLQRQCSWQNKAKLEGFELILGEGFPQREVPGVGPAQRQAEKLTSLKYISGAMRHLPSSLISTHLLPLPITHCPSLCCGLQANTFAVLEVGWFLLTWPHRPAVAPQVLPSLACRVLLDTTWSCPSLLLTYFSWTISCLWWQGEETFMPTDRHAELWYELSEFSSGLTRDATQNLLMQTGRTS